MSQRPAGICQEGFKSCKSAVCRHPTNSELLDHRHSQRVLGSRLDQHCPHLLGSAGRWLVKWHKNTALETTDPALETGNRRCLHFFLLAQSFFRLSQSLESSEKKTQLLLDGDLQSQQGPVSSGGYWQVWGGWRPLQLHLGVKNEEGQDEVMPERRHRAAQAGSVPAMERNTQSSSDSLSLSRKTEHPDVKETIYRSISSCQYLNDIHLSGWQV